MIRLALVGPGRWGRILVEAVQGLSEDVVFTRAVARSPAKAADWAARHGIALTDDLDAVLADPEVDAVVLATPHSQHAQQIARVAAAGKDLFCEKPVALTLAEARAALAAVEAAGIVFLPGHIRRHLPAFAEMARRVAAGELGRLLHAEGNMSSDVRVGEVYTPEMWRLAPGESPAGGLAAAGIHVIDLMIHLMGPVATLSALSARLVHEIDHDDTTTLMMRFASGATGTVGTQTATAREFRLQVFGARGWLELRGQNQLTWAPVEGPRTRLTWPAVSMERQELEAFARAIRTRTCHPIPMREVLGGIAVFEAVPAALAKASSVSVPSE
ncbi:Gfo/Idh/MocA family protein [Jannaschia seohaensis]|uniref:Myo-inositol 2-dehydrogenase / D-chiro-inositol 1-dehydrogenase n=1 Tax=Jannaschia seohaensis TaxID=475081 RepID=A0A2Y9A6B4_9RHOB|nr:Gfo/Idh/MocA family oxidoreductase [Jannaschia seohaensis]PWJ21861.1 myo-inositol 2-dehydrogenase/D-chiro-inositol 1-dehydrogenase [Jannaschia seohaensis]SSA38139.1 myo-inositol 2-dehydrogenase / D-chiro-inositol 1-dehydrogenase [Jannaschia seohaensis]